MRFESYEFDFVGRELRRDGVRIRLQAQPFEILAMMLERPGIVVSREALVKRLWPEGTFVDFEHSLNAAIRRLRVALGDDANRPRFVETLPRRGYRFVAPCEQRDVGVRRDRRPRVAVLPFVEHSQDPGQRGFSDGLTDETIVQLGRLDHLGVDVVASSRAGRRGTCPATDSAADYLLEGSVRRQGDRARIAAWLIETSDETQLWSDVYDRCLDDALAVQADVAFRIAGSLAVEIPSRALRTS